MTAALVFRFEAASDVRTVVINGEPWFVAKDVCDVIGIAKHRDAVAQVEEDERASTVVDTLGGAQQMTCVNESGLYALMLISRSPKAKAFRRWVTRDVLPQIRQTGTYGVQHALPATFADALRQLADETEAREQAEQALAIAEPKAQAFDDLMNADGTYSFEAAAKALADVTGGWGRNTLINYLRAEHIVQASRLPYQSHAKWFRVTAGSYTRPDGTEVATQTTTVRPEGLDYLRRRLSKPLALVAPA